jgi:hypothetical protein
MQELIMREKNINYLDATHLPYQPAWSTYLGSAVYGYAPARFSLIFIFIFMVLVLLVRSYIDLIQTLCFLVPLSQAAV